MDVHLDGSYAGGVSRLEVLEGPSGRRWRTQAERARIAVDSMMPGVTVADVARQHGVTRWQVYDWRRKLRSGALVVPEAMAALPAFAELVVEDAGQAVPSTLPARCSESALDIIVGDVVIRAGADADEARLARAIRAARAAAQ